MTSTPHVDIRVVLLSRAGDRMMVALGSRGADDPEPRPFALPRGVPKMGQSLDDTAREIVRDATGLAEQYIEQLYTRSVDKSTGGSWKVVVSYMALLAPGNPERLSHPATWVDSTDLPDLSEIDRGVIDYAMVRLRAKLGYTNIGLYLLPETFTLTELQSVYEAIIGQQLDKRNFRRRMVSTGILAPANGQRRDGSHRPAALYRFKPEEDRTKYLTPTSSDTSS